VFGFVDTLPKLGATMAHGGENNICIVVFGSKKLMIIILPFALLRVSKFIWSLRKHSKARV
jgi:hypothetical protein